MRRKGGAASRTICCVCSTLDRGQRSCEHGHRSCQPLLGARLVAKPPTHEAQEASHVRRRQVFHAVSTRPTGFMEGPCLPTWER